MLKRILRLDGWVLTVFEWPGDKAILHYSWPQGETGLGVGYWVVMGFWDLAAGQRWHTQLGEAWRDCHHFACLRFMRAALERKCFNQPCLPSMSITLTAIYLRHHRIKSCVLCAPHTHTHRYFFQQYISHSFCPTVILFYVLWLLPCWSPVMPGKPLFNAVLCG